MSLQIKVLTSVNSCNQFTSILIHLLIIRGPLSKSIRVYDRWEQIPGQPENLSNIATIIDLLLVVMRELDGSYWQSICPWI